MTPKLTWKQFWRSYQTQMNHFPEKALHEMTCYLHISMCCFFLKQRDDSNFQNLRQTFIDHFILQTISTKEGVVGCECSLY